MKTRVNMGKTVPALYQAMLGMDQSAKQAATDAGWTLGFCHLLYLRASQLNQCAFCMRMHARDALASGESADRLHVLPGWRESSYFNAREQAALRLVEAMTLVSVGPVPDVEYEAARAVLSDAEIAAVEWLAVVINGWNRIAIGSRYPVQPDASA